MRTLVVTYSLPCSLNFFASEPETKISLGTIDVSESKSILVSSRTPAKTAGSRRGSLSSLISSINLSSDNVKSEHDPLKWSLTELSTHSDVLAISKTFQQSQEVIHIGWPGPLIADNHKALNYNDLSAETLQRITEIYSAHSKCVPVFLGPSDQQAHKRFCQETLVPILHHQIWKDPEHIVKMARNWPNYVKVNELFAKIVVDTYRSGDIIWILDYELFLLPALLRSKLAMTSIGFFLKVPFPSSDMFRCLPDAESIIKGILGANVIGFQAYSYVRHFNSCCIRILGLETSGLRIDYEGFPVEVCVIPCGIDPGKIAAKQLTSAVGDKLEDFNRLFNGKTLFLGIESTTQVESIKKTLQAFERLKEVHHDESLILLIVLYGERAAAPSAFSKDQAVVVELANRINSAFGGIDYTPVQLHFQWLEEPELYALLRRADAYICANLKDSMPTMVLEYILSQEEKKGPIILSEFTALASSIASSIFLVNPWNTDLVVDAMEQAIHIKEPERLFNYERLFRYACTKTESDWVQKFHERLRGSDEKLKMYSDTPFVSFESVKEEYRKDPGPRLFLLDYDGTLSPIAATPAAAVPSPRLKEVLAQLCHDEKNYVYIISGRDCKTLDSWLGNVKELGMSAEHGCYLKQAGSRDWTCLLAEDEDDTWQKEVMQIFEHFTERTSGSFIEKKSKAITWHYRQADPEFGTSQARQCQILLEQMICGKLPVEVITGKKNLEVRPLAITKGGIVDLILKNHAAEGAFIFCAGDDRTDEDMFRTLSQERSNIFTCSVGPDNKKTAARYHVNNPEQLLHLLSCLAE